MKKNFKFLSTLALAGMLTTSVMSTPMYAATTEDATKTAPVGVCTSIIQGKNIVPFILANRTDRVTIKDIKDNGKNMVTFKNGAVPADNTVVCTGDTFKTLDGKEYTVVIYGDVDKDGIISVRDALAIQESRGGGAALDNIQDIAANVVRADGSSTNIVDALHIQQYAGRATETIIDKAHTPDKEDEEQPENSEYTVVVNENNIINNQNIEKTTIKIQLPVNQELKEPVSNVTLEIADKSINLDNTTIPANTSEILVLDGKSISTELNDVKDGTLTGKLKTTVDGKEVTLKTFTVEKNTVEPKVAQVTTKRVNTAEATMSFVAAGESDVTKMYYKVVGIGETVTNKDDLKETMAVSNNKLENAPIALNKFVSETKTGEAYKIYYIVENSYGSQSKSIQEAVITVDTKMDTTEPVENVELVKELSKSATAEFKWGDTEDTTKYIVTLLKKETPTGEFKVVKEYEPDTAVTKDITEDMKKPGIYKVSVVVKGADDGTTENSEAKESAEVKVEQLNPVTNLNFKVDNTGDILSWESAYQKDDIEGYKVTLDIYDEDKKEFVDSAINIDLIETGDKFIDLGSKIDTEKIYKAHVQVIAKAGQSEKVDSEIENSKEFFVIPEGNITVEDKTTENTVTLKLANPIKVTGKTTKYSVEIQKNEGTDELPNYKYINTIPVELTGDDKNELVINKDLVPSTVSKDSKYKFKLIVDVDGIKGESSYTDVVTMLREMPNIANLEVVSKVEQVGNNKIFKAANGDLNINGAVYTASDITNKYPAKLTDVSTIMDTLEEGDTIVSFDGEKLKIKLTNKASGDVAIREFANAVEDMILEIEANAKSNKTITTSATQGPKEVVLTGKDAMYNISGLNVKDQKVGDKTEKGKITLGNGVIVTTGTAPVTVASGATATINGVKVSAKNEITLEATAQNLTVTPNNGSNDLTFENDTTGDIEIKFKGDTTLGSSQTGNITIKANGGKITVKADNMNVGSNLDIQVTNGEVDVSDEKIGNDKTSTKVTMTATKGEGETTFTGKVKNNEGLPSEIVGKEVKVKTYTTSEEDIDELKTALGIASVSEELIAKINAYISRFGITVEGATMNVDSTGKVIFTLEVPDTAKDGTTITTTISNIK